MTYSIGGTTVIEANATIQWTKVVGVSGVITVNSTMQISGSGSEVKNGYYLQLSGTDLQAVRILGNCNCNCACACSESDGGA